MSGTFSDFVQSSTDIFTGQVYFSPSQSTNVAFTQSSCRRNCKKMTNKIYYVESCAMYLQEFSLRKKLPAKRIVYCRIELMISQMVLFPRGCPSMVVDRRNFSLFLASLGNQAYWNKNQDFSFPQLQSRWMMMPASIAFYRVRLHR